MRKKNDSQIFLTLPSQYLEGTTILIPCGLNNSTFPSVWLTNNPLVKYQRQATHICILNAFRKALVSKRTWIVDASNGHKRNSISTSDSEIFFNVCHPVNGFSLFLGLIPVWDRKRVGNSKLGTINKLFLNRSNNNTYRKWLLAKESLKAPRLWNYTKAVNWQSTAGDYFNGNAISGGNRSCAISVTKVSIKGLINYFASRQYPVPITKKKKSHSLESLYFSNKIFNAKGAPVL